ncbi:MAG TPA: hypothetical protein VM305_02050 [Candidatus Limnocylindrales bacterium]|nr:hypothetical protein [Candidatus Limnocylindrales bacterium]
MRKLDSLLMRADIIQVEEDRPDLDHHIVRGLYLRFVDCQDRQPDLDEFREYVDRITSSIDWLDLHNIFSPHAPTVEELAAHDGTSIDGGRVAAPGARSAITSHPRRPGRPGWTPELFWGRYRDACSRSTQPCTYRSVARVFDSLDGERGIDPDHLRKLLRRYGPPPP